MTRSRYLVLTPLALVLALTLGVFPGANRASAHKERHTPEQLKAFLANLEGTLRRELAALDESATFAGKADQRYTLVLALGAVAETPHEGGKS